MRTNPDERIMKGAEFGTLVHSLHDVEDVKTPQYDSCAKECPSDARNGGSCEELDVGRKVQCQG
jgi:hypothetical protein